MVAASVAGVLALGACSGESELTAGTSPAPATASATPTTNPTPTSTLTPIEQDAVDQAMQAVMAARQIGVDLYSGARIRINDLDAVTTGAFHDETVRGVSMNLAQGWSATPKGVQVTLANSVPLKIKLENDPAMVVVRMCIDATQVTAHNPDGTTTPGAREELDYTVILTTDGPAPAWAVSGAEGAKDPKDRAC